MNFKKITSIMLVLVMLTAVFAFAAPSNAQAAAKISKTKVTVNVGKTTTLKITGAASGAKVTWATSNKAVATVSKGKVKGVKAGTATITATVKEGTKSTSLKCAVTVKEGKVSVTEDFENEMDKINFYGMGGCKAALTAASSTAPAKSGKNFLTVTGRSQSWEGAEATLFEDGVAKGFNGLERGKTYKFSAWVKNNDGLSVDTFRLTMKHDGEYNNVAELKDVKRGEWAFIEGEYTIPAKGTGKISIYAEMINHAAASFSVDDFKIEAK